jgi:hypothetical protein
MPIPDIDVDDDFVTLVEDELDYVHGEWDCCDPIEICQAVIKIARLRSGENFA